MDYTVIYELTEPEFSIVYIIPIILIIATVALLIESLKSKEKSVSNIILYGVGLVLSIAILLYTVIGSYSEYIKYSTALKSGECLIVEGTIENFNPANTLGHEPECFKVSGVQFEYGNEIGYGYSTGDNSDCFAEGTQTRITYYNDNGTNVILKFEVNSRTGDASKPLKK